MVTESNQQRYELAGLPMARDADEPVFTAPWQATLFALTLQLHDNNVFSWATWSQTLAQTIAQAETSAAIVSADDYYRLWQQALEHVLADVGVELP